MSKIIYIPKIFKDRYIHFSFRGESCALRDFIEDNGNPIRSHKTSEIREMVEEEFPANRVPIKKLDYWKKRMKELNNKKFSPVVIDDKNTLTKQVALPQKGNTIKISINTSLKILKAIAPVLAFPVDIYLAISEHDSQIYQAQINDYVEKILDHSDEFVLSALNTPKFKNLLVQLTMKLLFETYKEKRKLILNYIINLGRGINERFDNHTKALRVLDSILPEEVATFYLWDNELSDYKAYKVMTDEERKVRGEFMNIRNILERVNKKGFSLNEREMYFIIKSLNSYGLLGVIEETLVMFNGGQADLKIAGITRFGEDFLKFIK